MFDRHNDKVIVAYYSPDGTPHSQVFDFWGLAPGSPARAARCYQYDRLKEALKGQGCDVHVWDPYYWQGYRDSFLSGKQRRKHHG